MYYQLTAHPVVRRSKYTAAPCKEGVRPIKKFIRKKLLRHMASKQRAACMQRRPPDYSGYCRTETTRSVLRDTPQYYPKLEPVSRKVTLHYVCCEADARKYRHVAGEQQSSARV